MSRELKFRAYDIVKCEFIYSDQIADGMWRFFKTLEDRGIRHFESKQYTGLKDKNGKEIYESDKFADGGLVIWNQDDCSFCVEYKGIETQPLDTSVCEWGEVIGNIYENPELLKR